MTLKEYQVKKLALDQYEDVQKSISEIEALNYVWSKNPFLNNLYNGFIKKVIEIYQLIPEAERLS